ncbi:unnamed protein product [Darwinula stevensoni]|uniref:Uncharacterized protein n=1 Tax=Darwinula stevensoni TaxID=69355 RepID=A0A7R8X2C8_9CRUS|nr:unnamed protein product [Darwinula stevensoni]CAG0883233.1 unnamed protein product [Darwinula stevensoni]
MRPLILMWVLGVVARGGNVPLPVRIEHPGPLVAKEGFGPEGPAIAIAAAHPFAVGVAPYATEHRSQYHAQDNYGNYAYGYANKDQAKEERKFPDGTVIGSYSYNSPDGTLVTNNYVADEHGFRSNLAPTLAKDNNQAVADEAFKAASIAHQTGLSAVVEESHPNGAPVAVSTGVYAPYVQAAYEPMPVHSYGHAAVKKEYHADPYGHVAVEKEYHADPYGHVAVKKEYHADPYVGVQVEKEYRADPYSHVAVEKEYHADPYGHVAVKKEYRADPYVGVQVEKEYHADPYGHVAVEKEYHHPAPAAPLVVKKEYQHLAPVPPVIVKKEFHHPVPVAPVVVKKEYHHPAPVVVKKEHHFHAPAPAVVVKKVHHHPAPVVVKKEHHYHAPAPAVVVEKEYQHGPVYSDVHVEKEYHHPAPYGGVKVEKEYHHTDPYGSVNVRKEYHADPYGSVKVEKVHHHPAPVAVRKEYHHGPGYEVEKVHRHPVPVVYGRSIDSRPAYADVPYPTAKTHSERLEEAFEGEHVLIKAPFVRRFQSSTPYFYAKHPRSHRRHYTLGKHH